MWRFLLFLLGLAATSPLYALELKLRHTLACHADHVVFSPDGKTLAAVGGSGEIKLWDLATGKSTAISTGREGKEGWPVTFSPDSRTLALLGKGGTIELRDLANGKPITTLVGHADRVYALAFGSSGKIVASVEHDKINLWDLATTKIIATYKVDAAKYVGVEYLAFSPDGKFLASIAGDKEVELWDLSTGKSTVLFHEKKTREWAIFAGVAFSPDSKTVAVAGRLARETIQLWSVATGKESITLAGHKPCGIDSFAFEADGETIISVGGLQAQVKVWDVATGKNTATLGLSEEDNRESFPRTFSPDGKMLALLLGQAKTIKLFDVTTGKETAK